MKLIPDWRNAWKLFSVQASALLAIFIGLQTFVDVLPASVGRPIALFLTISIPFLRLIDQNHSSACAEPTKDTDMASLHQNDWISLVGLLAGFAQVAEQVSPPTTPGATKAAAVIAAATQALPSVVQGVTAAHGQGALQGVLAGLVGLLNGLSAEFSPAPATPVVPAATA